MRSHSLIVTPADAGTRLDKYLAEHVPDMTRNRVQHLIEAGHVLRDGATLTETSRKVKSGEQYILRLPQAVPLDLEPLAMALDIVFEDAHLLVINKPVGLTVHPAAGNRNHTLVNALLHHCGDTLSGIGGVARPGIVHRIDKDTSGLLVIAKNDTAHQHLSNQLKARTLKRSYVCYAWGAPSVGRGKIDAPIARNPSKRKEMAIVEDGRHAITHYDIIQKYGDTGAGVSTGPDRRTLHSQSTSTHIFASKLRCELDTGRTHQIRVHMKHIGCPLIGDTTYGLSTKQTLRRINESAHAEAIGENSIFVTLARQALHAETLRFFHPVTGEEVTCTAPIPEDLAQLETALLTLTNSA